MNTSERVPDAIQRLRDGKRELREERRNMSLADKVRQVVQLQRVALPAMRRRRALRDWEGVWPIGRE